MIKARLKTTAVILCTAMIFSGCAVNLPFAKKKEKPAPPVYGRDAEYTKQVDDYIASADATVKTTFGDLALMDIPDTMVEFDPGHSKETGILKESLYLRNITDNRQNTQGQSITRFSYIDTKEITDPGQMSVMFVLQSADLPQSILTDEKNTLHKCYRASEERTALTVKYPDGDTEQVREYKVTQNGSAVSDDGKSNVFSYVYIIPDNGGYVFMETYSPQTRNKNTLFGKACDKAKQKIGEPEQEIYEYLKKYVDKNRDKLLKDEDEATAEDCRKISEDIIDSIYLARHDTDDEIAERQKKISDGSDITQYIPVYKPENTLEKPIYKDFESKADAAGYNSIERKKKEKKYRILWYYELISRNNKKDKGRFILGYKNKDTKKKYKDIVKSRNKNCEELEVIGKNFSVAYGYNKEKNSMWAVYYFPNEEEKTRPVNRKYLYKHDYKNNRDYVSVSMRNDRLPRIICFEGTMSGVIKAMKLIDYTKAEY